MTWFDQIAIGLLVFVISGHFGLVIWIIWTAIIESHVEKKR